MTTPAKLTEPDLKGIITKKGEFAVPLMLAANSLSGQYVVTAKYDNV